MYIMDDIKNRLTEYKYNFLSKMKEYLETEFIFYGSIKRVDYFESNSDIDIAIITDNPTSMLAKIKNYLNLKNRKIRKIYQSFNNYPSLINGYKLTYKDNENNWGFDVVIYNEKYRDMVMKDIFYINNLPFYITSILYILKFLYYKLNLISKSIFLEVKTRLFSLVLNKQSATL
jgi:predicted nucleotidyltransferase